MRCTAPAPTTTCSANAPTSVAPNTRSPGVRAVTSSPTSSTTPLNSLPGVNGGGCEIWYLSSSIKRSGKLIAAARTATRTSPGPTGGTGTSSTVTASIPS